ncbi:hypothetical protein [Actinacidiphila oryziradicis]|uniref:Uncharacterized protein n=1 Tax=Actinacidiphila oryziradicis TaxID=2571141 RepID=A0A4U0SRX3_9ACTN|nr:hypothetical protein [Actinacidiphila oryziradicis]TKA12168.1 hypothetical protein FCI23_07715 [Actinacidiphila oryziradicis]
MPDIHWDPPFCSEGANCFRLGTDGLGNAYIGRTDTDDYITDTREALGALITAIKNGAADHLL